MSNEDKAAAKGLESEVRGHTYYFSSDQSKRLFDLNPDRFLTRETRPQGCESSPAPAAPPEATKAEELGSNLKAEETQAKDQAGQEGENTPLQAPADANNDRGGRRPPNASRDWDPSHCPPAPGRGIHPLAGHQGQDVRKTGSFAVMPPPGAQITR